jgi:hypothetical protein
MTMTMMMLCAVAARDDDDDRDPGGEDRQDLRAARDPQHAPQEGHHRGATQTLTYMDAAPLTCIGSRCLVQYGVHLDTE